MRRTDGSTRGGTARDEEMPALIDTTREEPDREFIRLALRDGLAGRVEFALLYGSILSPQFNDESDVDCAAYFRPALTLEKQLDIVLELEEKIGRRVDLVAINGADLIITMQALANGELFIDNDHESFVLFKSRKIGEYIDFKMSRRMLETRLLESWPHA